MDLTTGQILRDRYRIVNKLAQGGFGAVYRAWDMNLRSHCAVKENLNAGEAVRDQFMREAKILSQLTHPHLPRVTDYFFIPGQGQYLVMDYIEGMDLQQMLEAKDEPLPQNKAMEWTYQVCDAIMYLHTQKPPIIHRDIKPANIKVTPDGRAVLVDFGIAKVFDEKSQTVVGAKAVTPGYSPPEQYGKGSTDVRSDVYSLGATLYALLTGEAPPSSVDIISKIVPPPQPPRMRNPAIPPHISDAVVKAMQMEKHARFASVAAFRDELSQSPPAPTYVEPVPVPSAQTYSPVVDEEGVVKPEKRSRLPLVLLGIYAGFLIIAAILVGGFLLGSSDIFGGGVDDSDSTQTAEWLALKFTQTVQAHQESVHATETALVVANLPTDTSPPEEPTAEPETQNSPTPLPPSETPTEEPVPGLADGAKVSEIDGMVMLEVPAGEFIMGADGSISQPNARPQHTVYLDRFWIDETEVTNKMYAACVSAGGCNDLNKNVIPVFPEVINYYGVSSFEDNPVIFVTWDEASGRVTISGSPDSQTETIYHPEERSEPEGTGSDDPGAAQGLPSAMGR